MDLTHPITPPPEAWLDGRRVRLRALEPEDLEALYGWENDPATWEQGCTLAPYSRYALREYIASASTSDLYAMRQLRLMIIEKSADRAIGTVDLYDFDPHHQRAGLGVLIDASCRGRGFGREAIGLVSAYAFRFLHLHLLYAHVSTRNTPSLRLFAAAGFQSCGTLPGWIRTAEGFDDVVVMVCTCDSAALPE